MLGRFSPIFTTFVRSTVTPKFVLDKQVNLCISAKFKVNKTCGEVAIPQLPKTPVVLPVAFF